MSGSGCFWQMLKAEELNLLKIYSFRMGRFSIVGGQGRIGVSVGGRLRLGHLHSSVPGRMTPVLVHFVGEDVVPTADIENAWLAGGVLGQDPISGKLWGTTCSFLQTSWLM